MAKIERKVIEGIGRKKIDVTGWKSARVEVMGLDVNKTISIGFFWPGGPNGGSWRDYFDGERVLIPTETTEIEVNGLISDKEWKLHLQNTIYAINQNELKIWNNGDNSLKIEGDDDIVYRGQDSDPATVDISGIRGDLENLSKLFLNARTTKTVTDAAKYVKLKNAILARYANGEGN